MAGGRSGRSHPRRHIGRGGATTSSSTSISAVRLMLVTLGLISTLYLISTHTALSNRGKAAESGNVRNGFGVWRQAGADGGDTRGSAVDGGGGSMSDDPRVDLIRNPGEKVPLVCDGPPIDVDLSYWKDIPADRTYEGPWGEIARQAAAEGEPQYVSFEPDHGGFNNIRMQMETVLVFAATTGRTLVMPPAQRFYLLNKPASEFADMFPVENFSKYMSVISTEEFLEKEGVTGNLGRPPPRNTARGHSKDEVDGYLRQVAGSVPHWDHMTQALVFGPSPKNPHEYDGATQEWLEYFLTKRTQLSYSQDMQRARLVHFRTSGSGRHATKRDASKEYRLFTHFYTFIGYTDPIAARHYRRLVRDAIHFRESLFCISSRIVHRLRTVGHGDPGRWSGYHGEGGDLRGGGGWTPEMIAVSGNLVQKAGFSTFHIRRGDFQYKRMKPEASVIMEATKDLRLHGEVLYIATDEQKKEFFDPFRKEHRVFFLDDFKDLLVGVDPTYYLMIDTIVASQGRTFIGTWRSTFTGYITRLRGYYNYPTQFSWYFWDETIRDYKPKSLAAETQPRSPFFMREWPAAWEDIDQDL